MMIYSSSLTFLVAKHFLSPFDLSSVGLIQSVEEYLTQFSAKGNMPDTWAVFF